MKNKSSKIISIGSIGDLCVVTHKSLDLPRQWNVGLIPIMFNSDKALVGVEKQDGS